MPTETNDNEILLEVHTIIQSIQMQHAANRIYNRLAQ